MIRVIRFALLGFPQNQIIFALYGCRVMRIVFCGTWNVSGVYFFYLDVFCENTMIAACLLCCHSIFSIYIQSVHAIAILESLFNFLCKGSIHKVYLDSLADYPETDFSFILQRKYDQWLGSSLLYSHDHELVSNFYIRQYIICFGEPRRIL